MLRHACGYALADQGTDTRLIQDYLRQRNIRHTVRYTVIHPARFERLWRNTMQPPTATICVQCVAGEVTTREHIPAELFFDCPLPGNLITIPSCAECNHGSQHEDEYLRAFMMLLRGHTPSPSMENVRPRTARQLDREPRYRTDSDMVADATTFTPALPSHHYPRLRLRVDVIAGKNHLTFAPILITRGLFWVLENPATPPH